MDREEFEQRVLDGKPKVAVFDCDGTLWGGDSGNGFMVWSIAQGLVRARPVIGSTRAIAGTWPAR